jgi:hypothetical protein
MSKPDAPPPPDYIGAAKAQGEGNIAAAKASTALNTPNQSNPFGTTSWSNPKYDQALQTWQAQGDPSQAWGNQFEQQNPGYGRTSNDHYNQLHNDWLATKPTESSTTNPGDWQLTTNLSPEVQKLFDQSSTPIDINAGEAGRSHVEDALYRRATQYLDPQRKALEATLADRGVMPGQDAYKTQLSQFDQQYGDARDRAIAGGGQESDRILKQLLTQRDLPIDELSKLKALMPSANPSTASVSGAPLLSAVNDLFGAQNNQYGIQSGQYGSSMSAIAGILAALGGGYFASRNNSSNSGGGNATSTT